MKFKKNQRSAKIPGDIGQMISVVWIPGDRDPIVDSYAVWLVNPQEMAKSIASEPAGENSVVRTAAIIGDEVIVSPPPAVDGNLKLYYYPPPKEA